MNQKESSNTTACIIAVATITNMVNRPFARAGDKIILFENFTVVNAILDPELSLRVIADLIVFVEKSGTAFVRYEFKEGFADVEITVCKETNSTLKHHTSVKIA